MKAKALQFGKALGAAWFVLLLVVAGTKNALAQTQVATLQHGEDISVFYGSNALYQAHNAAEHGDVITLSSGSFALTSITKAVTIRGAGCESDTIAGFSPTLIASGVIANIQNDIDTAYLTIEGVKFTNSFRSQKLSGPHFIKCYFNEFRVHENNDIMSSAQFVNCRFKYLNITNATNTSLINCVLWQYQGGSAVAYNSYIKVSSYGVTLSAFNCIVDTNSSSSANLGQYSTAINCIGLRGALGYSYKENCWYYSALADVFDTFSGNNIDYALEPLFLKEEIANTCLGIDGTQVGIHGGFMPYSNRPSYMVLKRCNVANKSTIDGKLSVEIEVVAEE